MASPLRIQFPGAQGQPLVARLDLPSGPPRAFALFAHAFACGQDLSPADRIARAFTEDGVAVLRFDFTGLGHCDGEHGNPGYAPDVADLVAAAAWLRAEHSAPCVLIGHSLAGAAVLAAAQAIPEAAAVATIGAPADPAAAPRLLSAEGAHFGDHTVPVAFGFRQATAGDALAGHLAGLGKALMVLHSPIDNVVGVDHARRIFQAAKHPKSFVSLGQADHRLSRPKDARYVATVLAAWASNVLDEPVEYPEPVPHAVVVRETRQGKYQQAVTAGPFRLVGDEPESVGGTNTGPSPYGYLMTALGTCSTMTMRMYAEHKGWPLARCQVVLRHKKIHAKDCADCETDTGKIDWIEREITLEGPDLTEDQRQRILAIADKCPVHRTLHNEVKVQTHLVES